MPAFVILSEAKNLMDSGTYTSEILRLTPQNDVVGQPPDPPFQRGAFTHDSFFAEQAIVRMSLYQRLRQVCGGE